MREPVVCVLGGGVARPVPPECIIRDGVARPGLSVVGEGAPGWTRLLREAVVERRDFCARDEAVADDDFC